MSSSSSSSKQEIKTQVREKRSEKWSLFRTSSTTSSSSTTHGTWETTELSSSHFATSARRPSEPVFRTDARPFQVANYGTGSPFPRQILSYASFRQSTPATSKPYRAQPNIDPRYAAATSSENVIVPAISDPVLSRQTHFVPTYTVTEKPKAKVLIINIKKFLSEAEERYGSEQDVKGLEKLFKDFQFDVKTYSDLKAEGILKKIDTFKNDKNLTKCDISIVVLMSHGNNTVIDKDIRGRLREVRGGFTQIFGADGEPVLTEDILLKFTATSCPGMLRKPKIFIFQCCRGHRSESFTTDGPRSGANIHADMLIAYSTLPGFYSIRDEEKGSWYIQSLCNVFKEYASRCDVENMLKIVHEKLNEKHPEFKQTSTYENRGFKTCYLQKQI